MNYTINLEFDDRNRLKIGSYIEFCILVHMY